MRARRLRTFGATRLASSTLWPRPCCPASGRWPRSLAVRKVPGAVDVRWSGWRRVHPRSTRQLGEGRVRSRLRCGRFPVRRWQHPDAASGPASMRCGARHGWRHGLASCSPGTAPRRHGWRGMRPRSRERRGAHRIPEHRPMRRTGPMRTCRPARLPWRGWRPVRPEWRLPDPW